MLKTVKVWAAVLAVGALALLAQFPAKIVDSNGSERQIGASGRVYNSGLVAITTGGTTITTATTKAKLIWCRNTSGSAVNINILSTTIFYQILQIKK